ncbi:isochorismatase family protein [uncultured Clostridium sp.]|jgi:nicotinamidase-related amidase|uniref:isochorismatase family protein n=1 Tax=uncultured Clostridium sp. TaxID=59620 RepID=UPI002615F790|nr:isochorismatase family protein [uncultured Clostridium sp.]
MENNIININKTAMVVIDLQEGIARREGLAPYSGAQVIEKSAKMVKAFRKNGGEVFLVRVTSDGKDGLKPALDSYATSPYKEGWDVLVPELAQIEGVKVITKRQWGAFYGTELELQLRRRGIDTIVLCGIATGIGVDTTAREAYQRGFNQIFVSDAMTGLSVEENTYVLKNIFPRIGRIRTTEEILEYFK